MTTRATITASEFRAAAKGRKPARLGYAAYVQGSNAMANGVAVGETALSAHTGDSFERVYLHDKNDQIARFETASEAAAAARTAAWNAQTFGSVPVSMMRKADCADGFVDVSGEATK